MDPIQINKWIREVLGITLDEKQRTSLLETSRAAGTCTRNYDYDIVAQLHNKAQADWGSKRSGW